MVSAFCLGALAVAWPAHRALQRVQSESAAHLAKLRADLRAEQQARQNVARQQAERIRELRNQLYHATQQGASAPSASDTGVAPAQQIALLKPQHTAIMGDTPRRLDLALAPAGTLVATDHPTLRWQPVAGATRYKIYIESLPARQPVLSRDIGNVTAWTPVPPLGYGRNYQWSVTSHFAAAPDRDSRWAAFGILPQQQVQRLFGTAQLHLQRGDTYTKACLLEDAAREYSLVPASDPHFAVAQQRLKELYRHLRP